MAGEAGYQPISEAQIAVHAQAAEGARPAVEPTLCPSCGAVFYDGRWRWGITPDKVHEATCPACARLQAHEPAAELVLEGPFVAGHGAEIATLTQETEAREKALHPLRRVMGVERGDRAIVIRTTSMHLARDIARALHHAYRGELRYLHDPQRNTLRVLWAC